MRALLAIHHNPTQTSWQHTCFGLQAAAIHALYLQCPCALQQTAQHGKCSDVAACRHRQTVLSLVTLISCCLGVQGSQMQLDLHDANEPNVLEPQHLPDTEVLAEAFRGCLQVCAMLSIKDGLDSLAVWAMLALQFEDAGGVTCT